jgi:hypothetical protein
MKEGKFFIKISIPDLLNKSKETNVTRNPQLELFKSKKLTLKDQIE